MVAPPLSPLLEMVTSDNLTRQTTIVDSPRFPGSETLRSYSLTVVPSATMRTWKNSRFEIDCDKVRGQAVVRHFVVSHYTDGGTAGPRVRFEVNEQESTISWERLYKRWREFRRPVANR